MNPGIDFPTVTVIQFILYLILLLLLLLLWLLEGCYMAFEKLICYFYACVTKQELNTELNMSHYSQHMYDGAYNSVQSIDKQWNWNYYTLYYCLALSVL